MRRLALAALVLSALATLGVTGPAAAITNGDRDGNAHSDVGGLVAAHQYSDGTWIYCSGTLISPTVFLTAAHCAEGRRVRVTFDPAYVAGDPVHVGTFHADPLYSQVQSDPHDLAVVVFDHAIARITPALLPRAGSLSGLRRGQSFTSVGYGAYRVTNGAGGHHYLYDDVRMVATGTLDAVNPAWLRISQNRSTGDGGTCYGDSGGPNFLGSSRVLAATTITGDAVCRSTNVDYRLDTASARHFLGRFVALP